MTHHPASSAPARRYFSLRRQHGTGAVPAGGRRPVHRAGFSVTARGLRVLVVGALLTGGLATGVANAPGAAAATGTAPVTAPDQVTLVGGLVGGAALVDVLKNDTDADGDELEVCRLGEVPQQLYVEQIPQGASSVDYGTSVTVAQPSGTSVHQAGRTRGDDAQLLIFSNGKPGTYTLTYYACDFSYLTPGTLTVVVEAPPKVKVKVTKLDNRPGHLKVTNNSGFPVRFVWGSYTADKGDGTVTVTRKPVVIAVNRPSIFWVAVNRHIGGIGYGAVRGIRLPAGTKHLPAGAPDGPLPGLYRARASRMAQLLGVAG